MGKPKDVRCEKTGVIFDVSYKRIFVDDITKLTDAQIEVLECGDSVVKITKQDGRTMKHTYTVSYKEEKVGICITYTASGLVETVSYDYTGGHWVYNSTDKAFTDVE